MPGEYLKYQLYHFEKYMSFYTQPNLKQSDFECKKTQRGICNTFNNEDK